MKVKNIFIEAIAKWWSADPFSLGAALAFYTIFSLVPLLIIVITITGSLVSPEIIEGRILTELARYLGPATANFISTLIVQAEQIEANVIANIIAIVTLILGSIGVFSQLQLSLNKLWNVPTNVGKGFLSFLERKVSALLMIVGFGFLFMASFGLSAGITAFRTVLNARLENLDKILIYSNYTISFLIVVGMFMFIYKYLPNTNISWKVAFEGSLVTGVLFILGSALIGLYLEYVPIASSYGAAGSVIVILLWVYYSSLVFFLGAAVTYVMNKRIIKKNVIL